MAVGQPVVTAGSLELVPAFNWLGPEIARVRSHFQTAVFDGGNRHLDKIEVAQVVVTRARESKQQAV